jgi:hypothetical protein
VNLIPYNHARSSSYGVRIALAPKGPRVLIRLANSSEALDAFRGFSNVEAGYRWALAQVLEETGAG